MDGQTMKMEPIIKHEKARLATFKKRKQSLMKKAYEISTLCDVEVCIILYGPKLEGHSVTLETWSSKEGDLISIIRKYMKKISAGGDHSQQRTLSLSKFKENKARRRVDDVATMACNNNWVRNFTTWDQRIDSLSEDQLKMILGAIDNKIEAADRKLDMIRGDPNLTNKATSRKLDHESHLNDAKSLGNMQSDYQVSQSSEEE